MDAGLKRTLDLCKRGLERERGRVTRAAEVTISGPDTQSNKFKKGSPALAVAMFLWAAVWMLRQIEVRHMKVGHVCIRGDEKAITIWLPASKCDQQDLGKKRTLGCSCMGACFPWRPWHLASGLVTDAKLQGMVGRSFLFRDHRDAQVSKGRNIKRWKEIFGEGISGHSPRRSGAMFYVRRGLPIQELAFLGRWKSGVVLQYAEEALQEKAVEVEVPRFITTTSPRQVVVEDNPMEQEVSEPKTSTAPTTPESANLGDAFGKREGLWVDKLKCDKCCTYLGARHVKEADKGRLKEHQQTRKFNGTANADEASTDAKSTNRKRLKNFGGRVGLRHLEEEQKETTLSTDSCDDTKMEREQQESAKRLRILRADAEQDEADSADGADWMGAMSALNALSSEDDEDEAGETGEIPEASSTGASSSK
eukprot:s1252_g22.t1